MQQVNDCILSRIEYLHEVMEIGSHTEPEVVCRPQATKIDGKTCCTVM